MILSALSPRRILSIVTAISVVSFGIAAPIWIFPVSDASATLTTADCAQTVGNSGLVTISVVGNDCVLTFSGDTTWTVPYYATSVRVLLVGGGAAGQADGGGGGGGGAGYHNSSISVTPGTVANIDVGTGGTAGVHAVSSSTNGSASRLDLNGDGSYEYSANGGSVGGGWSTRTGGAGGTSTTSMPGGSGGFGATTQTQNTGGSAGSIGFVSDISGTSYRYGGGGGGGLGSHSNGVSQTTINAASGGSGGGGAGATQRTRNSSFTWTYVGTTSATQSRTAFCAGNSSYLGTTRGYNGLNGFGGGGGGGSAYGDGCQSNPNTGDDGERTSGGEGGSGTVIIRFTDSSAPSLSSISVSSPASGSFFKLNDYISVTASFSEPVRVTGTPFISITIGGVSRTATYFSGNGTSNLVFRYQVTTSDLDTNGLAISTGSIDLNSGTLKDSFSNNAATSFSGISASSTRKVDGVVPTATMDSSLNNPYSSRRIFFTIEFSEVVTGFDATNTSSLKVVVGSNPSCSDADNSSSAGWTKQATTSGNTVTVTLINSNPQDANLKACVTAVGVVDQAGNALSAVETNFGLTRATQVTRWIKFIWGEDLQKF